ncbi:hypothetical protein ACFWMS_02030 [Peribacillus butanolivorans]|uniref:hypothetical protein n=1 Tax=Peribacillus butanolivorans TaxID=421767 RepID=UPI0036616B98
MDEYNCVCLFEAEETKERLAIIEANLLFRKYGGQMVYVEKDESNPFKSRYKVMIFNNDCLKHRFPLLLPEQAKEIVYYLPRK